MSLRNSNAKIKIPKLLKEKLKDTRILKILKKFEKSLNIEDNFVVAVSGGPDSLALAFLSKIYAIKKNLKVKFFIINHKLRNNSTIEAKTVKRVLNQSLIKAEILSWKGKKPLKNIQSKARKKRYELLFEECNKLGINNILLGHHQDDYIENFFIRILRGSGLKGLVSLDKKIRINEVNLLRPLLDFKKEDLIFLSNYVFNFYVKDSLNDDEKFQRIMVRKLIEKLKNEGLDKKKFIQTMKNLRYSNNTIDFYVEENLKKNAMILEKDNRFILNQIFFQQPYEVAFRSLSELIRLMGKKYYPVRGRKLDKIMRNIEKNILFKTTLGGCIIEKVNQSIIISKEQ